MTIMAQRDGQDGVYEHRVRDKQLSSIDSTLVNTRAQFDLSKYAYPHYTGSFTSFLQGWKPGQYFYLTSDKRMDGQFQKELFFVTKVEKDVVCHPLNGTPTFRYKVSISDTPYVY
jgi:hypothetical protein